MESKRWISGPPVSREAANVHQREQRLWISSRKHVCHSDCRTGVNYPRKAFWMTRAPQVDAGSRPGQRPVAVALAAAAVFAVLR